MRCLPVAIFTAVFSYLSHAEEWSYKNRRSLSSDAMNYFGVTEDLSRKEKEAFRLYNFSANISLLGDCGNLDFRASFKSIYAEANRLFSDLKEAAIGSIGSISRAAPMLALCYFSPTACSIAKNLQLYSSYSAKLKFDQCQAINKYISNQSGAYKEQQASCLRQKMQETGNITVAVESCKSSADRLASWLDGSSYTNISTNQLVKTSAKWAGISDDEANLLSALVGGIEYESRGTTRVNFGGYSPTTPGRLFDYYAKAAFRRLCGDKGLLQAWEKGKRSAIDETEYFQSKGRLLLDDNLMNALARLSFGEREAACDRLANSMSLTKFIDEMEERFDQLYVMSQNPHLPDEQREHLERKTSKLVDHTLAVLKIKNLRQENLNAVRSRILSESAKVSEREGQRAADLSKPSKLLAPTAECDDFTNCGGL
ncbi:MAG: hypothetical protein HYW48_02485 [Deltaproteobacteria bacterium]|nr:hypothetical protein [Deltaproteobacteria bacterium]